MGRNYKDNKGNGLYTKWYENGQKKEEGNEKDGKFDGLVTFWYENGQKRNEFNYKNDKLISANVWKPTGEKCPVTKVVDGNGFYIHHVPNKPFSAKRFIVRNGESKQE